MFCEKCGKELLDEALACPNCGCPTKNYVKFQNGFAQTNNLQNNNYKLKSNMSFEKANRFINKETEKVKKWSCLVFIMFVPFVGLFGMVDDYFPLLFILPIIVLIIIFALNFNEFSLLNKISVSDSSLTNKLRYLKFICKYEPIISMVILILAAICLFVKSR